MPRFDGTGPFFGSQRGYGRGCRRGFGLGFGMSYGRGFGRGFLGLGRDCIRTDAERLEALAEYKKALEEEIADIAKAEEELNKAV